MNEDEQEPVNNEVKLCLDDILTTLDGTSHQQQQASPSLLSSLLSPPPQTWTRPFLEDNILLAYLVNSKETELRRTRHYGLSDPLSEGVCCDYCGDSDKHITDIRGGGGKDEICVQWDLDWDADDPSPKPIGMAFYSCRSCFEDGEDPDLPIDSGICASCGIHNNLLGNEEETMMSLDYLEYHELNLPSFIPYPHRRGFCPHCVGVHTRCKLADAVIRRERYHEPVEEEEMDESLRTAIGHALSGLATPPDSSQTVRRRLEFHDSDDWERRHRCISCRIPNPHVPNTDSENTFTYHRAASGDRMLAYCPDCEAGHEIIVQRNERAREERETRDMLEMSHDSLEFTDDEDYEGEYENEELPENNTEKAKEIKDAVKEVGEKIFTIQEQLKEGDYLEIMNLLQKVTNSVNSL